MKNFRKIFAIGIPMLLILGACEKEVVKLTPETDLPVNSNFTGSSKSASTTFAKDLMAEQKMHVGEVQVWNDEGSLYVKYVINKEGWCLTETHLHVAMSPEEVPQKRGNAIPGHFDYKKEHKCVTEYTYTVELADEWGCDDVIIAAHAVVEDQNSCRVLLATENNHPTRDDQEELEARIWSIAVTGYSEMISDMPAPVRGLDTDNFNGNAYDAENGWFYFTDFGKYGGSYNQGPSPLYYNDLEGRQIYAGELSGGAAGGTFYNGKYYYIGTRTDDLYEVTLNEDGTVASENKRADIFGDSGKKLAFGDIDIRREDDVDVVYGSATELPGGVVFFRMELGDVSTYEVIKGGALYGAGGTQISFGSDGILYGVNAREPYELFSINPEDGATSKIADLPVPFSDLASGPVCELQDETAWGYGDRFTERGNWAMYFTYPINCCQEAIYLSDGKGTDKGHTTLHTVTLNADNTATVTQIFDFSTVSGDDNFTVDHFDLVNHIGTSPDGSIVYVIDEEEGYLGEYDVSSGAFTETGQVQNYPGGIVQVAVSPEGVIYVISKDTDLLYTLD